MGLDVCLIGEKKRIECVCECGHKHSKLEPETLYDSSITHNLTKMANEAGIYEVCWMPEEVGITKAKDIIKKLSLAVDLMKKEPERFKKFDSPNGWGTYEHFLPWVQSYLKACEENPEANIEVNR